MKIEKVYLDDHQVKLTVEVEPGPFEEAKQRAARHIAQHTKIAGFRPGKAPYPVIVRTVGEPAIVEEAIEVLVDDIYPKVIDQAEIKPYGPGNLEQMLSLDPPTFEFKVPLAAEATLSGYKDIRIPYELKTVDESDVARVIADLRNRQAVLETVSRPAQEGDQVFIRLSGERTHPAEGEDPSLIKDRPTPVVINPADTDDTSEWPFPGFARNLISLSTGDTLTLKHSFSGDSVYESLRGQEAVFNLTVEEVKARTLPELNDAFAQAVGEQYQTLEALQKEVRQTLEKQTKEEYDSGYDDQIVEQLLSGATIKYPPQMVEHEVEVYLDQLENRLAQQNMDMETYLKLRKFDEAALKVEVKPLAEKRLRQTLALLEVARLENVEVSDKDVETESMRALDEIGHYLPPEKARKTLTSDFVRNLIGNISADMLIKRTRERLQAYARGEVKEEPAAESAAPAETTEPEVKPKPRKSKKKVEQNESN